jgi:N-formylglutamate amidohydrolase
MAMETAGNSGFSLENADKLALPVLLSVPHAGRDYPSEVLDNLRISPKDMLRLEDRYADLLLANAKKAGFPVIIARKPRAWIDLNRAEDDVDREMLRDVPVGISFTESTKQRGGLGLIPRRLSGAGDVWKRSFSFEDIQRRIADYHRPYHQKVASILADMRRRFGFAILLDIHSMPPIKESVRSPAPSFVVGDRFGKSAAGRFAEMIQAHIEASGYICSLNHPYAGDHILRTHADPRRGIHAVQLEVDRTLYLDDTLREPSGGVARVSGLICELAGLLSEGLGREEVLAAE